MPWLFVATAFICLILTTTGLLLANHILVFFIGLVGLGASLIFFGLTATKRWKGYGTHQSLAWFFQISIAGIGYLMLFLASYYYEDVRLFLNGEYVSVSGVPTEIIGFQASRELMSTITVVIEGQYYDIVPKPQYYLYIEALERKTFTIYFLPNTGWIVDYDVH